MTLLRALQGIRVRAYLSRAEEARAADGDERAQEAGDGDCANASPRSPKPVCEAFNLEALRECELQATEEELCEREQKSDGGGAKASLPTGAVRTRVASDGGCASASPPASAARVRVRAASDHEVERARAASDGGCANASPPAGAARVRAVNDGGGVERARAARDGGGGDERARTESVDGCDSPPLQAKQTERGQLATEAPRTRPPVPQAVAINVQASAQGGLSATPILSPMHMSHSELRNLVPEPMVIMRPTVAPGAVGEVRQLITQAVRNGDLRADKATDKALSRMRAMPAPTPTRDSPRPVLNWSGGGAKSWEKRKPPRGAEAVSGPGKKDAGPRSILKRSPPAIASSERERAAAQLGPRETEERSTKRSPPLAGDHEFFIVLEQVDSPVRVSGFLAIGNVFGMLGHSVPGDQPLQLSTTTGHQSVGSGQTQLLDTTLREKFGAAGGQLVLRRSGRAARGGMLLAEGLTAQTSAATAVQEVRVSHRGISRGEGIKDLPSCYLLTALRLISCLPGVQETAETCVRDCPQRLNMDQLLTQCLALAVLDCRTPDGAAPVAWTTSQAFVEHRKAVLADAQERLNTDLQCGDASASSPEAFHAVGWLLRKAGIRVGIDKNYLAAPNVADDPFNVLDGLFQVCSRACMTLPIFSAVNTWTHTTRCCSSCHHTRVTKEVAPLFPVGALPSISEALSDALHFTLVKDFVCPSCGCHNCTIEAQVAEAMDPVFMLRVHEWTSDALRDGGPRMSYLGTDLEAVAAVLRLTDETDARLSHYVVVDLSDRQQPVVVNDANVSVGTPALERYLDMQGHPVIVVMSKSGRKGSGSMVDARPHATELMRQLSFLELCKASGIRETDAFLSEDRAVLGAQVPVEKHAAKLEARIESLRDVAALIAELASERSAKDAQPNAIRGQRVARGGRRQLDSAADSKPQVTASSSRRQQAVADSELQSRQQAAADSKQKRPSGAQRDTERVTHGPMQLHQMGHAAFATRTDAFDSTRARGDGEASALKAMTQKLPEQIASVPCWKGPLPQRSSDNLQLDGTADATAWPRCGPGGQGTGSARATAERRAEERPAGSLTQVAGSASGHTTDPSVTATDSRSAQELRPAPQGHSSASLGPTMRAQPQPPQQQQQDLEMQERPTDPAANSQQQRREPDSSPALTAAPTQRHPPGRPAGATETDESMDNAMGTAAPQPQWERGGSSPAANRMGAKSAWQASSSPGGETESLAVRFNSQLRVSDDAHGDFRPWAIALGAAVRRDENVAPRVGMQRLANLPSTREHNMRPLPDDHYPYPVTVIADHLVVMVYTKRQGGGDRRVANQETIMRDFGGNVCGEFLPGFQGKVNKHACLVLLVATQEHQASLRERVASISHLAGKASMTLTPERFQPPRNLTSQRAMRDNSKVQIGNVNAVSAALAVAAVERLVEREVGRSCAAILFEGSMAFCHKLGTSAQGSTSGAKPYVVVVRANSFDLAEQICSALHGRQVGSARVWASGSGELAWCDACQRRGHHRSKCAAYHLLLPKREQALWTKVEERQLCDVLGAAGASRAFAGESASWFLRLHFASADGLARATDAVAALLSSEKVVPFGAPIVCFGERASGCNRCGHVNTERDSHQYAECMVQGNQNGFATEQCRWLVVKKGLARPATEEEVQEEIVRSRLASPAQSRHVQQQQSPARGPQIGLRAPLPARPPQQGQLWEPSALLARSDPASAATGWSSPVKRGLAPALQRGGPSYGRGRFGLLAPEDKEVESAKEDSTNEPPGGPGGNDVKVSGRPARDQAGLRPATSADRQAPLGEKVAAARSFFDELYGACDGNWDTLALVVNAWEPQARTDQLDLAMVHAGRLGVTLEGQLPPEFGHFHPGFLPALLRVLRGDSAMATTDHASARRPRSRSPGNGPRSHDGSSSSDGEQPRAATHKSRRQGKKGSAQEDKKAKPVKVPGENSTRREPPSEPANQFSGPSPEPQQQAQSASTQRSDFMEVLRELAIPIHQSSRVVVGNDAIARHPRASDALSDADRKECFQTYKRQVTNELRLDLNNLLQERFGASEPMPPWNEVRSLIATESRFVAFGDALKEKAGAIGSEIYELLVQRWVDGKAESRPSVGDGAERLQVPLSLEGFPAEVVLSLIAAMPPDRRGSVKKGAKALTFYNRVKEMGTVVSSETLSDGRVMAEIRLDGTRPNGQPRGTVARVAAVDEEGLRADGFVAFPDVLLEAVVVAGKGSIPSVLVLTEDWVPGGLATHPISKPAAAKLRRMQARPRAELAPEKPPSSGRSEFEKAPAKLEQAPPAGGSPRRGTKRRELRKDRRSGTPPERGSSVVDRNKRSRSEKGRAAGERR